MPKSASFDIIGTCFSFEAPIAIIEQRLGPKLNALNLDAKTLFFAWFYAAQRDFTYVSMAGSYVPIAQVLTSTFRRACAVVDMPLDAVTDADIDAIMGAFKRMGPREGLKKCFDGLREAGWDVYGVTNGGSETSLEYFERAGIELDGEHLVSCDGIRVAKPDVRVYENADRHLTARGVGEGRGERWFVAAHAWDLVAARKVGFKTAYLDFEEHDPVTDVFGTFDLYVGSMEELLGKLKESS
ncbi:HAD-like protein [Decorospora gaudefroyi]|uniref:HAD-like protein n=1 Tax=Decorospora gaudefroyi TaxID=184978 RepID=A0A6A5K490_9PLEO|nr:HAD-like protein [Decorospora gaudefroyi]